MSRTRFLTRYFANPFRLDLRALALMRMGIGAVLLLDLLFRLPDLRAHYSDQGLMPLQHLLTYGWNEWRFSLHNATGLWQGQALLFALAAMAAVGLAMGWRTRLMTFASWVLLLSLHNRNPYVLQGGDDFLRLLLFWGLFMPWGHRWSVDAGRAGAAGAAGSGKPWAGVAGIGYVLLVFSVYFFSALLKTGPEWTSDYTALYYALSLEQIALPLGKLIYPYPELLRALTFATWWAELLLPLLLLIPSRSYLPRLLFVLSMALLHLGISLCLYVGLFFVIGWVSLLGLLPPQVMDRVEALLLRAGLLLQRRLPWLYLAGAGAAVAAGAKPLRQPSAIAEGLLAGLVIYCLFWNLNNTPNVPYGLSHRHQWLGQVLRLDQFWGMFAPAVFKDDGWYIMEGTTTESAVIDLNQQGRPVHYRKPERVVAMYSSDRWRKYSEYYLLVTMSHLRLPHCHWLLREWNNHREPKVAKLEVVYMKEVSLPDYRVYGPKREVLCSCDDPRF